MNEIIGELQWRTAVRGQCFSFVMPWGQMLREYSQLLSGDDWAQLPRGQDCLQYLFRLHLKVAGTDFEKDFETSATPALRVGSFACVALAESAGSLD